MKNIFILIFTILSISNTYGQTAEEYHNRGNAKGLLKDWIGAITEYTKAIELEPKNTGTYFLRGFAKGYLQDDRGAILDLTKVIELEPNHADAYYYRGLNKIMLDIKDSGCLDLSKAGQLGNEDAYNKIKELCVN